MELAISAILAYALLGIAQVGRDLDSRRNPLYTVGWALQPTLTRMVLIGAFWVTRSFAQQFRLNPGQIVRPLARGLLFFAAPMAGVTLLNWGCITLAEYCFDNIFLIVAMSAVLMIVGTCTLLPLMNLFMLFPVALIDWVLDLLLPRHTPGGNS